MANNRLWLIHRPSGAAVCLGKRMDVGWYRPYENLETEIALFFDAADTHSDEKTQDDFTLAIEDATNSPLATDKWDYNSAGKPVLR